RRKEAPRCLGKGKWFYRLSASHGPAGTQSASGIRRGRGLPALPLRSTGPRGCLR
ncbi:hypothetical protein HMPREF3150_04414, partial [Pseudomonas aeruginosa]